MRSWIRKSDGTRYYSLPNCSVCERRSSTSDKETAQMAEKYGRICRACSKKAKENMEERKEQSKWKRFVKYLKGF